MRVGENRPRLNAELGWCLTPAFRPALRKLRQKHVCECEA